MNWQKRYAGFQSGDKIKIVGHDHSGDYSYGGIYTLKEQYIKDGVWILFHEGEIADSRKIENYWNTEELGGGIEERSMALFTDE